MVFGEVLETALNRFRTHPVQTWLTLAGLIAGTAAIILIVSLGLTGRGFVMEQIEGVGSHLVWASYEGTVTSATPSPNNSARAKRKSCSFVLLRQAYLFLCPMDGAK